MHPQIQSNPMLGYAIGAVVMAGVSWLRWRGMARERPLRLETLWVLPAIYGAAVLYAFVEYPPPPIGWLWCAVALAVGSAIGWQRGKLMRITIDPDTHALSQQGSPAAFLLLIALVLLRQGARYEFGGGHAALLLTGIAMALGFGLIAVTRLEMTLRARRLLAGVRG